MIGFLPRHPGRRGSALHLLGRDACLDALHHPVVLILGFWLPCTLALQIIYPALDKAFHLEKTITARREDEIND